MCTTLKQIVRDWSSEGENERKMCYKPILDELNNLFSDHKKYFNFAIFTKWIVEMILESENVFYLKFKKIL